MIPGYSKWKTATMALDRMTAVVGGAEQLHQVTCQDETSTKLLAAVKRVREHYVRLQTEARAEVIKFAETQIPSKLREAGEKITSLIKERLVDPSTIVCFAWASPGWESQEVPAYSYIIRIKDDQDERIRCDIQMGRDGQLTAYSLFSSAPKGEDFATYLAQQVISRLSGWSGLRGESDKNAERSKLLNKISPILLSVCRQFAWSRSEVDPVEVQTMNVSCGFRANRLESLSERDRDGECDVMRDKVRASLKADLGALAESVARIDCDYGEKGWYSVNVVIK